MKPWDLFRLLWSVINLVSLVIMFFFYPWALLLWIFSNLCFLTLLALACSNLSWSWFITARCKGSSRNGVSLTFDDGPSEQTIKVLDVLRRYQVKATFFLIGKNCETYPDIVEQILQEGHSIGLHSYSHSANLYFSGASAFQQDIQKGRRVILKKVSADIKWYRPPFGVINPHAAHAIKAENLTVIGWSLRSFDTNHKCPETTLKRLSKKVKNDDIVLLHDRLSDSAVVLERFLILLKEKKLDVIPLQLLLDENFPH